MTAVAVSRLRVRSPPDRAVRTQARVEDALRVAPTAAERLLVVRRLALGRIAADARPERWHARTAEALGEQSTRAVHGGGAGASQAGAVWFRSADEARALLLRELAAGRRPIAWFWRLAVRDWNETPFGAWLARWIAAAERDPEAAVALARAVVAAAEAGLLPAMVAAAAPYVATRSAAWLGAASSAASPPPAAPAPGADDAAEPLLLPPSLRLARRALLALPASARLAFQSAFIAHRQSPAVLRWLAQIVVTAAAPDMASSPAAVAAAADALILESQGERLDAPPRRAGLPDPEVSITTPPAARQTEGPVTPRIESSPAPADETAAAPAPHETPQADERMSAAPEIGETTSAYAGLLLLVRPLSRLGLAEWLSERPEAQADGFARQLLRAIGRRMGADGADAVLAALDDRPDGDSSDEDWGRDWGDAITAWRVGLDRWLRRTARVKLADVVKRRGGVLLGGDRLDVRFPLAAADTRLRRHALDLDPLWTPWLGLSIRYHFQDQPLQ